MTPNCHSVTRPNISQVQVLALLNGNAEEMFPLWAIIHWTVLEGHPSSHTNKLLSS